MIRRASAALTTACDGRTVVVIPSRFIARRTVISLLLVEAIRLRIVTPSVVLVVLVVLRMIDKSTTYFGCVNGRVQGFLGHARDGVFPRFWPNRTPRVAAHEMLAPFCSPAAAHAGHSSPRPTRSASRRNRNAPHRQ